MKDVCRGDTGHAEVAQIEYDPEKISYAQLLDMFWKIHDPTTYNRQGPDVGSQYRSVIFYRTDEQKELAQKAKERMNASKEFSSSVVTEIAPAGEFWKAEDYHQRYFQKQGISPTCHIPKK